MKCWVEFGFVQTFRPTILVDGKMLDCFAALPTKLYPQAGHVRPPIANHELRPRLLACVYSYNNEIPSLEEVGG